MGTLIRINGTTIILSLLFAGSSLAHTGDTLRKDPVTEHPFSRQYEKLQEALARLYAVQKQGGWPKIIGAQKFYLKGQTASAIKQIKQRLRISGDFTSEDTSGVFTPELVGAVQKIQKRLGYEQNGVVDALLIKQLNIPVEDRIQQVLVNMDRLQRLSEPKNRIILIANIPEYKLHVYEGPKHVFDMDIVVGSENHKTVLFNDEMTNIVFSPYWNVPPSIVENEILPAMRHNKHYLRNNGYEITGQENGLPVIRQKPGTNNSLGQVKFVFPNDHGIYFHDTPAKGLFQYPKRTFSHGCIRLAEPARLAAFLLRSSPEWTEEKIRKAMSSGKEQWVKLSDPVAVSLTYYTAWVDDEGLLQLRQDIYGLDKVPVNNIAGR
jgi:murein L,D-transpeptidase YcbB/YkuD